MPSANPQIVSFGGANNAKTTPHLLDDGEVLTSTNLDFGQEPGAAVSRHGSTRIWTVVASPVTKLFKHYKNSLSSSILYAQVGGSIYRVLNGTATATTTINTGYLADNVAITQFKDYIYTIGTAGANSIQDNGTATKHWIKNPPATAPTSTVTTLTPLVVSTLFNAGEGSMTSEAGGTATFTTSASPYRIQINGTLISTNLNSNSGNTIGDSGIHYVELLFSNPNAVAKISQDYSIGNTDFTNVYHTEFDTAYSSDAEPVLANPEELIESQLGVGASSDNSVDLATREDMLSEARTEIRSPTGRVVLAKNTFSLWSESRPNFELITKDSAPIGWDNIQACRIIIECKATTQIKIRNWTIAGALTYPLNDADVGYAWAETVAEFDAAGFLVSESTPGPFSTRVKMQNARALTTGGSPAATDSSYTHRILYRQGGYLRDFYAVATNLIGTATYTDTVSDVSALTSGFKLNRNLYSRAGFPNNIVTASEIFYNRIFLAHENRLRWSLPGRPGAFPILSESIVSHSGDEIRSLIAWPPGLVVVNRDSVYEMQGTIFEGDAANWSLNRTGSKHGSKAPLVCIKTPFGIPLLELDGLYMYIPGSGIDQPLAWLMGKIGDAWRGTTANDPAAIKGNRAPAINRGQIHHSCAEYYDGRLYLAVPTGSNTYCDTLFVLDFTTERVWWYKYPFNISSLMWDVADFRLLAGSEGGYIFQIEAAGSQDQNEAAVATGIVYTLRSKPVTAPTDFVLENVALEYRGGGNALVKAIVDNTSTITMGTLTSTTQDWFIPPFSAQVHNNIIFGVDGTSTGDRQVLYQVEGEMLVEPKRVEFWRTEHQPYDTEQIWDVHQADLEIVGTGTVTGIAYVDNTAVMTRVDLVGPTSGRKVFVRAYPNDTYGQVGYTKYNTTGGLVFKHWQTVAVTRPEPPRILNYVSPRRNFQDEQEFKTTECCIDPIGGTVTQITVVDGTAVATNTYSSAKKTSVVKSLPNDLYGRIVWAEYSGPTVFKFYDDWFESLKEPDRVNNWKFGPVPFPSQTYVKTWYPTLNPNGTMTGILYLDNTAISTSTFVGTDRQTYNVGLDVSMAIAVQTGSFLEVYYTGTNFKHYDTQYETEAKPFGKNTWLTKYEKIGGATEIDMARWWSYDIEASGTATITSIWDTDIGSTNTETITVVNRQWVERKPFPPGVRFHNLQHRLYSVSNFKLWKDNIDIERQGVKGFSRITKQGVPQ